VPPVTTLYPTALPGPFRTFAPKTASSDVEQARFRLVDIRTLSGIEAQQRQLYEVPIFRMVEE